MNDDAERIAALLEELRDGQKLQLARQQEALELQRQQFTMLQGQAAKTDRIQDRAERLQDNSAKLMQGARRMLVFLIPVIIVLIVYVSWLIFRPRY